MVSFLAFFLHFSSVNSLAFFLPPARRYGRLLGGALWLWVVFGSFGVGLLRFG